MIVSNLPVLLAERGLKIAEVSRDTKLSRTTLTALSSRNHMAKGIQFDTLNTLCAYLNIQPGALFSHYPLDFTGVSIDISENSTTKQGDGLSIEITIYYRASFMEIEKHLTLNALIRSYSDARRPLGQEYFYIIDILPQESSNFLLTAPIFVRNVVEDLTKNELINDKGFQAVCGFNLGSEISFNWNLQANL